MLILNLRCLWHIKIKKFAKNKMLGVIMLVFLTYFYILFIIFGILRERETMKCKGERGIKFIKYLDFTQFLSFIFYWATIDLWHYISVRDATEWFKIFIYGKMITTVILVNIQDYNVNVRFYCCESQNICSYSDPVSSSSLLTCYCGHHWEFYFQPFSLYTNIQP